MKKVLFIVLLVFVASLASNAQSFSSKSEDSFFKVKKSPLACGFSQNLKMDDKFSFVPDDENDTDKKRRKKKRRGRGGSDYSNSIKTNPLSLIFGTFGVMYERKINDNISLGLTGGIYFNSTDLLVVNYKYSGFNISPEFRYYFDEAIEGWYAGAFISVTLITEKITSSDGSTLGTNSNGVDYNELKNNLTLFNFGAMAGRQWIWGGFTLDVFGGLGYTTASWSYDSNYADGMFTGGLSFKGILPVLGSSIGYSF